MPYIKPELRPAIDEVIQQLDKHVITAGDLNYAITKLILRVSIGSGGGYNYIALVTGVLENVKLEFYRKFATKFEDGKEKLNGEVYPL